MARIFHIVALAALALALAGMLGACGASSAAGPATTPAAQPDDSSSTADGATGTAATGGDSSAAADIQKLSDYTSQLTSWFTDFAVDFQNELDEALQFEDPAAPTESELLRARQDTDLVRQKIAELSDMSAPAKVAKAHAKLCSALHTQLAALERYVNALDWGSPRDVELALRDAQQSAELFAQAVNGLEPYVDLSSVMQN